MEPGFKTQVICIGQNLRIKGCANYLPLDLQQKLKETHDMLVHASTCPLDLILEMNHVVECKYPKCYSGKVLWRHICYCHGNNCLLCNSMRLIGMFHARQCTNPNCAVPRCSEFRDMIHRKERKARNIEKHKEKIREIRGKEKHKEKIWEIRGKEDKKASKIKKRLKRLRKKEGKKEGGQKRIFSVPLSESQLVAAAGRQLSLKEDQGDQSTTRMTD